MTRRTIQRIGFFVVGCLVLASANAQAETLTRRQNIADLIEYAEIIIHGDVVTVTDGIDNNIPYTEVTVKVKETIRGKATDTFTFRQFGLLKPRPMGNGLINYAVNPEGWASYRPNEEVILFLYTAAKKTGLRTTVGLAQGKFAVTAGRVVSQQENVGLFENVALEKTLLKDSEKRLFTTTKGPVSASAFLSFVRRAVADRWIETRRMSHAK